MRIIVLLVALVLLFGCTEQPQQPPSNQGGQANQGNGTNQTAVGVIIGPQQNQTAGENTTGPQEPPDTGRPGPGYDETPNATLGMYFIDVGGPELHGNAILIKKGDLDILVDAGPAENAGRVVDSLRSSNVDDIELLVSTSADPRNYGGIPAVADRFDVECFWWGGSTFDDPAYDGIVKRMRNEAGGAYIVQAGNATTLNGITLEVLNPAAGGRFWDINNDAVVLRASDRNFSILLTSNIQKGAQGRLINDAPGAIKTRVMQAPYYGVGAGTSDIRVFLINARPKAMVITGSPDESAANGGSRDPFRRVMRDYGIPWYENYVNGSLRLTSDGNAYSIQLANGTDIEPPAANVPANYSEVEPVRGTGAASGSDEGRQGSATPPEEEPPPEEPPPEE